MVEQLYGHSLANRWEKHIFIVFVKYLFFPQNHAKIKLLVG